MNVTAKWRPSLAFAIALLCVFLVTLPVVAMLAVRLTSNQFVRETERSLLAQATLFSESYAQAFRNTAPRGLEGHILNKAQQTRLAQKYHPIEPSLNVSRDGVLPPQPDWSAPSKSALLPPYAQIGPKLSDLAETSQKTTLAGYIAIDAAGDIIASSTPTNPASLAHIDEIARALRGETVTVLRARDDQQNRHPFNSISRDTNYRVFVAMPVVVENRVVGAVYLSRTPIDLQKYLYSERGTLFRVGLIMAIGALLVGFAFWRFISRPIHALQVQSAEVASGSRTMPEPLRHYGMSELAGLGASILEMAEKLSERADAIETYTNHVTHELKSPVTSIVGAAELLETSPDLDQDKRARLASTITAQGQRMNILLERLRDLSRAKTLTRAGNSTLAAVDPFDAEIAVHFEGNTQASLPLSEDQLHILLTQMTRNAAEHGASFVRVAFDAEAREIRVTDNGEGISAANLPKITDPFFTTKRDSGGTGMGLAIVMAVLESAGATLVPGAAPTGAQFTIQFPQ